MYELSVALRYLIPKKRALSTSLISILSFLVISMVVWLALVFLSVTSGLEENWLNKLTAINAPLKITPTPQYYSSYYYLIDSIASSSDFETKTIAEKANTLQTNPYLETVDASVPYFWPKAVQNEDGSLKDLVKGLYESIDEISLKHQTLQYQDYEMSGAFLRLLLSTEQKNHTSLSTSFLSQMSYLVSFQDKNPNLQDIIVPITKDDLNSLFLSSDINILQDSPNASTEKFLEKPSFLEHINIQKVITKRQFTLPFSLLPEKVLFSVKADKTQKVFYLLNQKTGKDTIQRKGNTLFFNHEKLDPSAYHLFFNEPVTFIVNSKDNNQLFVKAVIQNIEISGKVLFQNLELLQAQAKIHFSKEPPIPPPWSYYLENKGWVIPKNGVLMPKSYKDSGVLIGDQGYLAYNSMSAASTQEQRIPFRVAGFYDPGVMPVGNRFIFVPHDIVRTINMTSSFLTTDTSTNGIMIWMHPIKSAQEVKVSLENKLKEKKLHQYWKVESYQDYDFSKALMQQFQSDKLLFTLIALIIIIVACSNIISMLLLLVNDKRKEIAILVAMGSSKKSISIIFGLCGFSTGVLSSFTGIIGAIFTLKHLHIISSFLSSILGHEAFNSAFFGDNLPNKLSISALLFIAIVTPLISLMAGIIPAIKAARLNPSNILRSQ